jgi:predicted DNA-binding transcriptional regulator
LSNGKVEAQLKGNTLRVYIYALKRRRVGVREVQRALSLSNPSLAQYHLNKLRELGLLKEESGEYQVSNEVRVDVMRDFLRVGTLLVPRFVFYAAVFSVFTLYLAAITFSTYGAEPILVWFLALLSLASGIFWYEAQKAWRSAPSP